MRGQAVPAPIREWVMDSNGLRRFIDRKRDWSEPLSQNEIERGFKGWHASKYLPHFDAPGTRQFITYRLADALPASRRREWEAFLQLEEDAEKQRRIETYLDQGYGGCQLRDPRIANLVQENLWYHDGVQYRLLAWVIMPNHIHVLVEIWHVPMSDILKGWKGYSSKAANRILGRTGTLWEEDYFDRYIRDENHYRRVVRYMEGNPAKAGLVKAPEEWAWSSARYRGTPGPIVPALTHPTAKRMPGSNV
jgi:REP element-mobilizing transposase RayT